MPSTTATVFICRHRPGRRCAGQADASEEQAFRLAIGQEQRGGEAKGGMTGRPDTAALVLIERIQNIDAPAPMPTQDTGRQRRFCAAACASGMPLVAEPQIMGKREDGRLSCHGHSRPS